MHQSVQDRVGYGRVSDPRMPFVDGELAGHERGPGAIAVLQNLEQVVALLLLKLAEAPVVEDEQVELGPLGEKAVVGAFGPWGTNNRPSPSL